MSPMHEAIKAMNLALATLDIIAAKLGVITQGSDMDTLPARRALTASLRRFDEIAGKLLDGEADAR